MLSTRMQQAQWPRCGITAASSPSPRRITCHAAAEESKQPEHIHVQVNELYSGKITKVKPQVALVTLDNQAPAELYFDHVSSAPVEDLTKLFQVDEEIKAVVISSRRGRPAKLSIREIEMVPGQMLTDKQAVFQAAPQAIKLYQERKEQTMEARRQALALLKIGDVVPATVKSKRKEGWLVGVGGVYGVLHHGEYVKPLEIGQTLQVRVRKVLPLSAMAYVSARSEPGSEGANSDAQPSAPLMRSSAPSLIRGKSKYLLRLRQWGQRLLSSGACVSQANKPVLTIDLNTTFTRSIPCPPGCFSKHTA